MTLNEVVVIDYGMGNLLSVQRSLEYCGAKVVLTSDPEKILAARRIVLPGVGAFDKAMHNLNSYGLHAAIVKAAGLKTPLLGICLGMQLLFDESDEFGVTAGLGLISGRVIEIPRFNKLGVVQKIPHIGWNRLIPAGDSNSWNLNLLKDIRNHDSVYFVHSFMGVPTNESDRIANCVYGGHNIAAVVHRENIMGCQFHPEKSGDIGLKILRSFLNI
jgi:glutamine amidotransferase